MNDKHDDKPHKLYRFFYHFNKPKRMMTLHWKGACFVANNIKCNVPCETKWNKKQPYLVMQGFASNIICNGIYSIRIV